MPISQDGDYSRPRDSDSQKCIFSFMLLGRMTQESYVSHLLLRSPVLYKKGPRGHMQCRQYLDEYVGDAEASGSYQILEIIACLNCTSNGAGPISARHCIESG